MITPDLLLQPFAAQAASGDVTVVPQTSPTGFVNFSDGYTSFYEINLAANNPLAKAVERGIMNYLFNALSKNAQAWQYQGLPAWYSTKPGGYEKNAYVMRVNGGEMRPYRSQVAANVTDPLGSPSSWEYVPFASEALQNVPMPWGGMAVGQGPATAVITAAVDFNSLSNGTWVTQSNVVAAACANCPFVPGSSAVAGMLEARDWAGSGGTSVFFQRYSDILGNIFVRYGSTATTWQAWNIIIRAENFQNGRMLFAATAGTTAYTANFNPAVKALVDGMELRVRWGAANTVTAVTLNVNGLGAKPVYGTSFAALQIGTLVAGSLSTVVYVASSDAFVLKDIIGGYVQGVAARNRDEVPNWGQVTDAIGAAQPTSVPWAIITGVPDIVYTGTTGTLQGLELVSATPFIDFRFGSDVADYNFRVTNDADKTLRFYAKGNATAVASFGDAAISFNRIVTASNGLNVGYNNALNLVSSVGGQAYWLQGNDNNLFLNYTPSNGGVAATSFYMVRSTGQIAFSLRPTFAGQTPWDTGNFNPANYLVKGANGNTNGVTLSYASGLDIGNYTTANQSQLQLENGSNGTPALGLLRVGIYGAYIGMAANNQPFWGGWSAKSDGSNGYLITSWNYGAWFQILAPALAVYAVGMYMMAMQVDGGPAHGIGEFISAAGSILCAASGANGGQRPNAGTLRCMGYSQGSGVGTNFITLWQRVA